MKDRLACSVLLHLCEWPDPLEPISSGPASEYTMETYLDCIPCFFRQAPATARVATPDPMVQRRVLNSVAFMMPDLPLEVSPPEIAQNVYCIVREVTGNSDPYRDIKARANAAVLKRYFYLKDLINKSESPMKTACKLAIAGNCIDLGPSDQIGEVDSMLGHCNAADLIVAKGQGNYESLNDRNENIFFLLKVKCPVIARSSGYALGEPILHSRFNSPSGQSR